MKFLFWIFLQKQKPHGPKGLWHKIFENHLRFGRDIRLSNISAYAHCSASDEIHSAYAQPAMKFVPRMLSMDLHVKTVHILPLAEHARKFVPRMLSVRWKRFLVCSVCDKIVSTYAQHAHAIWLSRSPLYCTLYYQENCLLFCNMYIGLVMIFGN